MTAEDGRTALEDSAMGDGVGVALEEGTNDEERALQCLRVGNGLEI